jgi:hypothetical protein
MQDVGAPFERAVWRITGSAPYGDGSRQENHAVATQQLPSGRVPNHRRFRDLRDLWMTSGFRCFLAVVKKSVSPLNQG